MPTENRSSDTDEQSKPVLTLQLPDPYDERPGPWFAAKELRDLAKLPAGTKLYTHADPGEAERLVAANTEFSRQHLAQLDENQRLRAQLAERDALLGAISGWTAETREAVLQAFQEELNESASCAWYDDAIADLMKLVETLSAAEPIPRDHEIPGTSFQRLNMLANQGE